MVDCKIKTQRGFIGLLMVTVLLVVSLLIPAVVRITEAVFYNVSTMKTRMFVQNADDAKYVFVKYFHDHPDSVVASSSVSCGKVYIPPDTNPASFIISRDAWGGAVQYQKWDLRSESPPASGLIIRFVSAGPDRVISTTKNLPCSNSDICYEIFNCEMDNLVTAYTVKNGS